MNRWGGKRVRFRTVIVLGALVATDVLAVPRPAPAAGRPGRQGTDTRLRFFDFNMCGASCNDGDLVRVVKDVRDRITSFRPHVATLNEACQAQVERLESQLRASAWPMNHVFNDQRDDHRCPPVNGKRLFGDAVFSAGPLGFRKVVPLPKSQGGWDDDRALLCVNTHLQRDVLACVVHLEADAPKVNRKQLAAVARFLNPRAAKGPVVLAGDFNAEPWRLAALTSPQQGGQFVDLVPGRRTRNKQKIDYILVSRGSFSDFSGGVKGSKYSDHRVLTGAAELEG